MAYGCEQLQPEATVGKDLQLAFTARLEEAPRAAVTLSATSDDGARLLVSTGETPVGAVTVQHAGVADATARNFWAQALAALPAVITCRPTGMPTRRLR